MGAAGGLCLGFLAGFGNDLLDLVVEVDENEDFVPRADTPETKCQE